MIETMLSHMMFGCGGCATFVAFFFIVMLVVGFFFG